MEDNRFFKEALANVVRENAYAAAVRHLTEEGMSISDIVKNLTYPAPFGSVQKIAFEHMLKTGILLRNMPEHPSKITKTEFVVDDEKYGRKSFRKVTVQKENDIDPKEYIPCDFGLLSREQMERLKEKLSRSEWEYIKDIPWEKRTMYHRATPMMQEIDRKIRSEEI